MKKNLQELEIFPEFRLLLISVKIVQTLAEHSAQNVMLNFSDLHSDLRSAFSAELDIRRHSSFEIQHRDEKTSD